MVAADQVDSVWVAQLEANEERYGFDGKESTVDIIACGRSVACATQHRVATDPETDSWCPGRARRS
jgi:hypothetical protein